MVYMMFTSPKISRINLRSLSWIRDSPGASARWLRARGNLLGSQGVALQEVWPAVIGFVCYNSIHKHHWIIQAWWWWCVYIYIYTYVYIYIILYIYMILFFHMYLSIYVYIRIHTIYTLLIRNTYTDLNLQTSLSPFDFFPRWNLKRGLVM